MRPTKLRMLGGLLPLALLGALFSGVASGETKAAGKDKTADAPPASGLRTGPATVAPHWSKYKYPDSVAEGASYHIVEKGDTLWDLSRTYLKNPYLWPQIWDKNRYVTDAHWIYPGDPIVFPQVSVMSDQAGKAASAEGGAGGPGGEGLGEGEGPGEEGGASGRRATDLYPVSEEMAVQCSGRILPQSEDESLKIIGSEQGDNKVAFGSREIVYLNKGSNAGVKVGDVYTIQRPTYKVKHPVTGKILGTKIETSGWLRVLLVTENSATATIEQSCTESLAGDYLRPYEKVRVPLVARRTPPDRMTPPSGKANGYIVDNEKDRVVAGTGGQVGIDLGSQDGIAPGSLFTVFRVMYPHVPTSRNVIGELAVLTVADKTATAQVTYSTDTIVVGDHIELR